MVAQYALVIFKCQDRVILQYYLQRDIVWCQTILIHNF